jgi:hypothetical protein
MNPRNSRVLLIEGTSGIGKSTLIDALLRKHVATGPERKLRTLLHLAQSHTYGPLAHDEDVGTLTVAHNLAHLEQVTAILEWHVRALTERPGVAGDARCYAVIDTLHLTQCQRPGVLRWPQVAELDVRLAALGARLLFAHASPETIWQRGVAARRNSGFIGGYARRRWGPALEAIHAHLVGEQIAMRATLRHTRLEHRALRVDGPLADYVETAYDFWKG